jgi:hypothetical protein
MIKGTTPTLQFKLPFDSSLIKKAEIVVMYVDANKEVLIVRNLEDCTLGDKSIETKLTQEETLKLPAPSTVEVQLRIVTTDDSILATVPEKVTVKRLLKEDVIE